MTVPVTGTSLPIPAITQAIVDKGQVLIYFSNSGTTGPWYALPYTNGGTSITMVSYGVGVVNVTATTQQTGLNFKIVVIPGISVQQLNVTNPGLNFRNYSEVASALRLRN
jgi:hypothetical protein